MKSFTALRAAAVIGAVLMLWIAPLPATADAPPPATADAEEVHKLSDTNLKYFGDNEYAYVKLKDVADVKFFSISLLRSPPSGNTSHHGLYGNLVLRFPRGSLVVYPIESAKWVRSEDVVYDRMLKLHIRVNNDVAKGTLKCTGPFYDQTLSCKGKLRTKAHRDVVLQFGTNRPIKDGVHIRRVCPFRDIDIV